MSIAFALYQAVDVLSDHLTPVMAAMRKMGAAVYRVGVGVLTLTNPDSRPNTSTPSAVD